MDIAACAIDALTARASLRKVRRLVAMRLNKIWLGLLALLLLFLAVVWYDGGRQPQRLIEQPVELPPGYPDASE
jgi:hypothetical protein